MAVTFVRSGIPIWFHKHQHAALGNLHWKECLELLIPQLHSFKINTCQPISLWQQAFILMWHSIIPIIVLQKIRSFFFGYDMFTVVPVCVCEREWILANWKARQPWVFPWLTRHTAFDKHYILLTKVTTIVTNTPFYLVMLILKSRWLHIRGMLGRH